MADNLSFEVFFNYKNQFLNDILTDDEIVSLIDEDFDLENGDRKSLVYTKVFPLEYIPETVESANTYIMCDVDISKPFTSQYIEIVLYVWILCHKSLLLLPNNEGVRVDKIASKIIDKINGSRYYGRGELDLYGSKRISSLISDYQGRQITFKATDVGRFYNPDKPTPKNRRRGV